MNDSNHDIEYIDAYFKNELNDAQKKQFEELCLQDESFAGEVAIFITTHEGIRQKLLQQKRELWAGSKSEGSATNKRVFKVTLVKLLPYVAAACLIVAIAFYFLFRSDTPQQLADKYVHENLVVLSKKMKPSPDSLQQGIAAYNDKDYDRALLLFSKMSKTHPDSIIAKKYIGLVFLLTKDYDKALLQFNELARIKNLYKNDVPFLKAVTFLERNKRGDKEMAKQLLEQVVNEKAEGWKEAEEWLRKW